MCLYEALFLVLAQNELEEEEEYHASPIQALRVTDRLWLVSCFNGTIFLSFWVTKQSTEEKANTF